MRFLPNYLPSRCLEHYRSHIGFWECRMHLHIPNLYVCHDHLWPAGQLHQLHWGDTTKDYQHTYREVFEVGMPQFQVFPESNSEIQLNIIITFKWLENGGMDPNVWAASALHLLPPHMIFQDSCRLLFLLGLQFGMFKHFNTWEDLQSWTPTAFGQDIVVRSRFLDLLMFSKEALHACLEDSKKPWTYNDMEALMSPISQFTGFTGFGDKMKLHSLQYGGAYLTTKHFGQYVARKMIKHGAIQTIWRCTYHRSLLETFNRLLEDSSPRIWQRFLVSALAKQRTFPQRRGAN